MFGLRNVNIQQALANRTTLVSSLGHGLTEATVTRFSDNSLKGRTVSLGSELSSNSMSFSFHRYRLALLRILERKKLDFFIFIFVNAYSK